MAMLAENPISMDAVPTTIILFAHGSNVSQANDAIAKLAAELSQRTALPARCAFLDVVQPDLAAAVAQAVGEGAGHVPGSRGGSAHASEK